MLSQRVEKRKKKKKKGRDMKEIFPEKCQKRGRKLSQAPKQEKYVRAILFSHHVEKF